MANSMTGFGRATREVEGIRVLVEVKSVNHRFCDIQFHMPRSLMLLEEELRKMIKNELERGKIDIFIRIEGSGAFRKHLKVDWGLLDEYIKTAEKMDQFDLFDPYLSLQSFLLHPDVAMVEEEHDLSSDVKFAVTEAVSEATEQLLDMRKHEGEALKADIIARINVIRSLNADLKKWAPTVVDDYRERLKKRVSEFVGDEIEMDESRLLTEVAVFSDKANVEEEMTRLDSHANQFLHILEQQGSIGRKLDFLTQEMNREANTIGSKGNDVRLSHHVVELKHEFEKIKEQIQNIE